MKINKDNYENWFLDYHEGSLTDEQKAEVIEFLDENPAFKEEFENFEMIMLDSNEANETFPSKGALKKNIITHENVGEYLISKIEGRLTSREQILLEDFLRMHPGLRREEELFSLTKILPDTSIIFEDKKLLKKPIPVSEGRRRVAFYFSVAAAACILILIGIYFFRTDDSGIEIRVNKTTPAESQQLAVEKKDTIKQNVDVVEKKTTAISEEVLIANKTDEKKSPDTSKVEINKVPNQQLIEEIIRPEHDYSDDNITQQQKTNLNEKSQMMFTNPSLVKESLLAQLESNPQNFNAEEFDSYLEKVSNPDSTFSEQDLIKPVFTSVSKEPVAAASKKESTPVLNALAWGLGKIASDVKLKKNYNKEGELVAYHFESGKVKFGNRQVK